MAHLKNLKDVDESLESWWFALNHGPRKPNDRFASKWGSLKPQGSGVRSRPNEIELWRALGTWCCVHKIGGLACREGIERLQWQAPTSPQTDLPLALRTGYPHCYPLSHEHAKKWVLGLHQPPPKTQGIWKSTLSGAGDVRQVLPKSSWLSWKNWLSTWVTAHRGGLLSAPLALHPARPLGGIYKPIDYMCLYTVNKYNLLGHFCL